MCSFVASVLAAAIASSRDIVMSRFTMGIAKGNSRSAASNASSDAIAYATQNAGRRVIVVTFEPILARALLRERPARTRQRR